MEASARSNNVWPSLPLEAWSETYATLHMWSQVIGKVRLSLSPPVNHWWHCALYVSSRGLTTSAMPFGKELIEIEFDFIDHQLVIRKSDGQLRTVPLAPHSVAGFYHDVISALDSLDVKVSIFTKPQEVPNPIPFEQNNNGNYDPEYANRFWRALSLMEPVFEEFRGRFIGKCSPINFYWGSFDLACTRFNGRRAPARPGADLITREAYSHECISAGFWPGLGYGSPAFYSYTAPAPAGLEQQTIAPGFYSKELSEFLLPYDDVRTAESPREALLQFLQSSYEAGANLAGWNREELERR
ncbi:MAG TPA: DUF5996 family protein [Pyrinomonadaceae bacterium]|jgi:hypothetical protein